ncbi:RraA family protein [Aeribacillus sp. FSL K6-8394]|uniref:RraA family protein n=1 Tax=Aeribacillus sp. FSL K6-8394 TaxID=2954570 RepID=UPI0030F5590E
MSNIGFRIYSIPYRPKKELVEKYQEIVTPHISDNMNRIYSAGYQLRPFHKQGKLVGVAFTVKTRPGDNLMVHKAIDMAQAGDVIVVDAGGDMTNAIVGEIMLRLAQKKGIAGFVIDGAIRDSAAFASDCFPVYARGITHRGPYKDGPGEINVPIVVAGMFVKPGDILVGDEDGLVAVPCQHAEEILEKAQAQKRREQEILKQIEEGTVDRSWVDKLLQEKGCEWIDGSK